MDNSNTPKRVLIVGGVAGGASVATRLRRLDEHAEIHIFERGPHVSFANCGLPYHVGSVIEKESSLIVAERSMIERRFNVSVHTESEVIAIHRDSHTIDVKDLRTGEIRAERYDALVLSPGAAPIRPPLPGLNLPGVFTVRAILDAREIRQSIDQHQAKKAVVIGGGFIGLEMAENLLHRGLDVTIVEKLPQLMPPFDREMVVPLQDHLREKGVHLQLNDGLAAIEANPDAKSATVVTESGARLQADLVILAIGVRPDTALAKAAGIAVNARGGIIVSPEMRTSDASIWAVGDAVEVADVVSGQATMVPLAGPANRQGRIAAESIAGRSSRFRGIQGTAIVGVLGMALASTGLSEKALTKLGIPFEKVYLHPGHHAGYFPGAQTIHLKLLFSKPDGRILGAQATGFDGVDKRIDVIATMIQMKGTVSDLSEVELSYAPQFGSAKDPLNLAGMIAENVLAGDMPLVQIESDPATGAAHLSDPSALVLDVRTDAEVAKGTIRGALHIPLDVLRTRLSELPRDRAIAVLCRVGQRGYVATRILRQNGFDAKTITGGYLTYGFVHRPI